MYSMRSIVGEAIILDSRRYKEADTKTLLSTDRYGHIYAIAPNARKSKHRFVGGLNILSHIEFSIDGKGELFILNESTLIDDNEDAFKSINAFLTASVLLEISERLFTLNNPDETAFYKLKFALKHIGDDKDTYLIFNFLRDSLITTGEIPEFERCAVCQSEIDRKKILFNYYKGGILCRKCAHTDNRGEYISSNLYDLMLSDELEVVNFDIKVARQGIFLLERYIRFKLNLTFKSFQFI